MVWYTTIDRRSFAIEIGRGLSLLRTNKGPLVRWSLILIALNVSVAQQGDD